MKTLSVSLDYGLSASMSLKREGSSGTIALPVKVLDAQGTVLAEGLASTVGPTELKLGDGPDTVYVRLAWPGGRTETHKVSLTGKDPALVSFSDSGISHNEWSAWALPRLARRNSLVGVASEKTSNLDRFRDVWIRVWMFEGKTWHLSPLKPIAQFANPTAKQIDLTLDSRAYLMQIGNAEVPWRFVALPGGGPCRVLFTPNDSGDPRSDPLKVIVTSFRNDAETLLEFLSRDAVRAARTMASSEKLAVSLFAEKFSDPIGAVAGAYYLLRIGNGEQAPLEWWHNLSTYFPWLPDTSIVHCVRILRNGLSNKAARTEVLQLFKDSVDRGWPVYEEGLRLLQEAASLLRHIAKAEDAEYFARVELLTTAKAWAGSSLSFHGRTPDNPSAVLWLGTPRAPRRRRLSQPQDFDETIEKNLKEVGKANPSAASFISRQLTSLSFSGELAPSKVRRAGARSALEFASIAGSDNVDKLTRRLAARGKSVRGSGDEETYSMLLGDIGN